MIISVIIVATGIATKGVKKFGKHARKTFQVDSLQKTAMLGTSHIIRKVLESET